VFVYAQTYQKVQHIYLFGNCQQSFLIAIDGFYVLLFERVVEIIESSKSRAAAHIKLVQRHNQILG